jgi:hypothetical protein
MGKQKQRSKKQLIAVLLSLVLRHSGDAAMPYHLLHNLYVSIIIR